MVSHSVFRDERLFQLYGKLLRMGIGLSRSLHRFQGVFEGNENNDGG